MAKETAESKLLKLIEASDAADGAAKPAAADAAAGQSAPAADVLSSVSSVGVGGIALPPFLQKLLAPFFAAGQARTFGLRELNILLVLVIVVVAGLLVREFSQGAKESRRQIAFEVTQRSVDGSLAAVPFAKEVVDYVAVISQRNIFQPFEKKVEEIKVVQPVENQKIKDKVTNFKLVGISWLNSPETATVMIEDKSTSITHFKRAGEELNGVTINAIYADRVEMRFQDETLTMSL